MTAAEKQQLARIEALRAQVVGAVQTFAGACRRATGGDIVKALFAAFGALGTGCLLYTSYQVLADGSVDGWGGSGPPALSARQQAAARTASRWPVSRSSGMTRP